VPKFSIDRIRRVIHFLNPLTEFFSHQSIYGDDLNVFNQENSRPLILSYDTYPWDTPFGIISSFIDS